MDVEIIMKNCPAIVVDPEKSQVQAALVQLSIQQVRFYGPSSPTTDNYLHDVSAHKQEIESYLFPIYEPTHNAENQ